MLSSVELFSGCGGLALGLSRAGFRHELMVEFNDCAVATLEHNKERKVKHVKSWPVSHDDVRLVDWSKYQDVSIVAGGPPCQPFSIGGKANGASDDRDMWPAVTNAVRDIRPEGFLFENVRGLTRPRFSDYLGNILRGLSSPDDGLNYSVAMKVVNAADFGAAQKRHRVVIAGVRGCGGIDVSSLCATHSREALAWDQWVSGRYWKRHGIARDLSDVPRCDVSLVKRLKKLGIRPSENPWVTVRDKLEGLGEPNGLQGHVFQGGAKVYKGHTGSPLDQPAKALKAGDHGVPGGENMMVKDDGSVRYFTIRESARLQGFPDDFEFPRSWSESMRQLGNAVPVELSTAAGLWLKSHLSQRASDLAVAA